MTTRNVITVAGRLLLATVVLISIFVAGRCYADRRFVDGYTAGCMDGYTQATSDLSGVLIEKGLKDEQWLSDINSAVARVRLVPDIQDE